MEEEDELALLDYRTPKGQLIKLLEQKIKKPEIDDSLGKVLDQFTHLTNEQTTFLDNGIFQMNFAEDALLLQSCGLYYAKRVDKLWDEVLQFHTRMVKYDEIAVKNSSDSGKKEARKRELEKLEERLNRGKRKKIKLTESEAETPQNGCYVFDHDANAGLELLDRANLLQEAEEEPAVLPFEQNFDIFDAWREIHCIDELEKKKHGSVLVSQYNRQKYRLNHYSIPNGEDIIYDKNDPEEFNTREGRLISVHHIRHLFDYNDRCLLPDEDFTIAKLRFAYVLKKKWLVEHKVDPDAPYETYKAEYEKYQREYFENEKRKIQNMPQRNAEDLIKFYKALEKKEQLATQAQEKLRQSGVTNLPAITFESLILDPLKEGYEGDYDPYIPMDDESQPEGLVQVPTDGDHELELSNLFVDLPKLPDTSAEAADKLRSDSGYFDGGFEVDDESDREDNTNASVPGTDTPFEFDKDNTESKGEGTPEDTARNNPTESTAMETEVSEESSIQVSENAVLTEDTTDGHAVSETPGDESLIAPNDEAQEAEGSASPEMVVSSAEEPNLSSTDEQESMNREIREFVKCGTEDVALSYAILENSFFKKIDDAVVIIYNKGDTESVCGDSQLDEIIDLGECFEKPKVDKSKKEVKQSKKEEKMHKEQESIKRKLDECQDGEPLPKRRKLSQKQIEKLKRSLIEPIRESKWESFFSMNYQAETGEGEITRIDYESSSEDEDDTPADLLDDEENHDDDSHIEDQDDDNIEEPDDLNVCDHNGSGVPCRPETPPLPLSQDSGIDMMDISTNSIEGCPQTTETEALPAKDATPAQETGLVELGSIDLIAELSKNTGISREELDHQQQSKQPELTKYEQQREKVRERVSDWKEYIMPKLKKLDEHDFDIHEYGSKIMDRININESKRFSELVTGQSSAEVVRFFISSLQLANTMNVKICGAKKGELSNDSFELKLLSKERYHEHLNDYQAPSEECLHEKLKKVKQIRMQNKLQTKQSHTKRKTTDNTVTSDNHTQQAKPQSIMKRNTARPKTLTPNSSSDSDSITLSSPNKRIKILNYNVIASNNEATFDCQLSPQNLNCDFQRPSTSWQADIADQQNELNLAEADALSPVSHMTSRSSIDSGFMPSCDEDFLDQFDQLQQITDTRLRSTPVKPRKVLRVSFARNTNF